MGYFHELAMENSWNSSVRYVLQSFKPKRSKVKFTVCKRRLLAKLLLSFRKSEWLNLMAMSDYWSEAAK